MKVTTEHLEAMRAAIEPLDTPEARDMYRRGDFPRSEIVQDVDIRYRWDLLYASRVLTGDMCSDYTMGHLDTALRQIVEPLR